PSPARPVRGMEERGKERERPRSDGPSTHSAAGLPRPSRRRGVEGNTWWPPPSKIPRGSRRPYYFVPCCTPRAPNSCRVPTHHVPPLRPDRENRRLSFEQAEGQSGAANRLSAGPSQPIAASAGRRMHAKCTERDDAFGNSRCGNSEVPQVRK